jgi:uncharacterized protein YeaO (DUF488 family)
MIKIKRVYENPEASDGHRVLVDRLWPRGFRKDQARIDIWLRDLAPSQDLRQWFAHDPERWPGFQERYLAELSRPEKSPVLEDLLARARKGNVTLVYAAHDTKRNNAVVLKNFLEQCLRPYGQRGACPGEQLNKAGDYKAARDKMEFSV